MLDYIDNDMLILGITLAIIGLIGGAIEYFSKGRHYMKNYSTIRESAKINKVPYTVIQGWVQRRYVRSIRVGQGGDYRKSGELGMLQYHNIVHDLDVSSLADQWKNDNPGTPKYLTASQYVRYNKKRKSTKPFIQWKNIAS